VPSIRVERSPDGRAGTRLALDRASTDRRAFRQVPPEPGPRGLLVFRRSALGVEMDELGSILEGRLGRLGSSRHEAPRSARIDH